MGDSNLDWLFCIVLSYIVLRHWWKHSPPRYRRQTQRVTVATPTGARVDVPVKTKEEPDPKLLERLEYEKQLRKQGYSDELIAIILPTINND